MKKCKHSEWGNRDNVWKHTERYCPFCGKQITVKAVFCSNCGKKVAQKEQVGNEKKKCLRGNKKWFFFIILLALIFLIIVVKILRNGMVDTVEAQKKLDENNPGEIYFSPVDVDHIGRNEDGIMYADNEILLVAQDNISYESIQKLAKSQGAEIVGWIEQTGDYQLKLSQNYSDDELNKKIDSLEKDKRIASASINYIFNMSESRVHERDGFLYGEKWEKDLQNFSDCAGKSWGFEAIETLAAWDVLQENKEKVNPVRIGLIDNGFDANHEDLEFAEIFYGEHSENNEHGTHVAGTMAANANNRKGICGVYPYGNKNLYAVSHAGICAYTENGSPRQSSMFFKIAYSELILRNVKVINSSLGFNYYKLPLSYESDEWQKKVAFLENNSYILADFLKRLLDKGYDFVIVNAAGNDSERDNGIIYDSKYSFWTTVISKKNYPEIYDRIIVVGAVNSEFQISDFSNGGDRVDIYAPGEIIFSTLPENKYGNDGWSGTSMAAPHISGVTAMAWSLNNHLSGKQIKEFVCKYSNNRCGSCKMVDAYKVLEAVSQTIQKEKESSKIIENGGVLCWVVNAANEDEKIKDARVIVTNLETRESTSTTTDKEGHFELILEEGQYSLIVQADGYEDYIWPDGHSSYENPIIVKNNGVNYLDNWIKMRKKEDSIINTADTDPIISVNGAWDSEDGTTRYIFNEAGLPDVAYTMNGTRSADGEVWRINLDDGESIYGKYMVNSNSIKIISELKEILNVSFENKGDELVIDGLRFCSVNMALLEQLTGTWKGDENTLSFGKNEVKVYKGVESRSGVYAVLSESQVLINIEGDEIYKIPYSVTGNCLNLNGTLLYKEGADTSYSGIQSLQEIICGTWIWSSTSNREYYVFKEDGTYQYYPLDSMYKMGRPSQEGVYEIQDTTTIYLYSYGGNLPIVIHYDWEKGLEHGGGTYYQKIGGVQTKKNMEVAMQKALNYYHSLYPEADGNHVIFEEETMIQDGYYIFTVRWQMSDEEAMRRMREGEMVAANIFAGQVYYNIRTGEMRLE